MFVNGEETWLAMTHPEERSPSMVRNCSPAPPGTLHFNVLSEAVPVQEKTTPFLADAKNACINFDLFSTSAR